MVSYRHSQARRQGRRAGSVRRTNAIRSAFNRPARPCDCPPAVGADQRQHLALPSDEIQMESSKQTKEATESPGAPALLVFLVREKGRGRAEGGGPPGGFLCLFGGFHLYLITRQRQVLFLVCPHSRGAVTRAGRSVERALDGICPPHAPGAAPLPSCLAVLIRYHSRPVE